MIEWSQYWEKENRDEYEKTNHNFNSGCPSVELDTVYSNGDPAGAVQISDGDDSGCYH